MFQEHYKLSANSCGILEPFPEYKYLRLLKYSGDLTV